MKNNDGTTNNSITYERIFKIAKKNNIIDLTGSLSIINNSASEKYFENEAFEITFSTSKKEKTLCYSILVNANEAINEEDKQALKLFLNIDIIGCGMYFHIVNFLHDFNIQFDTKNSAFKDTPYVKNGLICFKKTI